MTLPAARLAGVCLLLQFFSCVSQGQTAAVVPEVTVNFDTIFDWKNPWITVEELDAKVSPLATVPGRPVYTFDSGGIIGPSYLFNPRLNNAYSVKNTIFGHPLNPTSVRVGLRDGRVSYVTAIYAAQESDSAANTDLLAGISLSFGTSPLEGTSSLSGKKTYRWSTGQVDVTANFLSSNQSPAFVVSVKPTNAATPDLPVVEVDLDQLIDWKRPLETSREVFDAKLRSLPVPKGARPYALDSGTAESAHIFSTKLSSLCVPKLLVFGRSLQVKTARVEWKDQRPSRMNFFFEVKEAGGQAEAALSRQIDGQLGLPHESSMPSLYSWSGPDFVASLSVRTGATELLFSVSRRAPATVAAVSSQVPAPASGMSTPASSAGVPPAPTPVPAAVPSSPTPAAAFKLRLAQTNGLLIAQLSSGEEAGQVTKMILTAVPNLDQKASVLQFNQKVGDDMRGCLNEVYKLALIRHERLPAGHTLEIGFEDKYVDKDGPSAAVACSLLMESALTGETWDPLFAVTGDLNADGSVQPIGGVRAKIRGATNGSCKLVAVPAKNEKAVADILLLDGPGPLVGITVFGIKTFDDALLLARAKRPEALTRALADFEAMRAVMLRDPKQMASLLRTPHAVQRLQALYAAAPDCYSAKYLLGYAQGRVARMLSLGGSIEAAQNSAQAILYAVKNDVATAVTKLKPDEVGNALSRLRALRPSMDPRVWPFVDEVMDLGEILRSAVLNPVRSGARYQDLMRKVEKTASSAESALSLLMNSAEVREELGL